MPNDASGPPPQGDNADLVSQDTATGTAARRLSGRRRWMRRGLLSAGPLLVAAVAGYFYLTGGHYVGTENAYVKANMVMVSAEVSGPIVEVAVHENQRVAKGDVLFRIDDRPYRIALRESDAELANVVNEIASLKASYGQKIEERTLAQADLDFATRELDRQSKLLATATTSRSKFDATRHEVAVMRQRIRVIDQEMAQIKAQLGGDPEIEVTTHPRYLKVMAAEERARLDLERTVVRAPFDGIASNTPEPGQQVIGGETLSSPVMSIVAAADVWIEANFKETDLTHVRPGQPVTITVDSYPDHDWHGIVHSISQATGAEFSVIPPQNATGNWVKVVQRIPVRVAIEPVPDGPALRAGMSTTVAIDTGHSRPLPGFVRAALSWIDTPVSALASTPETRR